MSQLYEELLNWFSSIREDSEIGPLVEEWLTATVGAAEEALATCTCLYHRSMHAVALALHNKVIRQLYSGVPAIKLSVLEHIANLARAGFLGPLVRAVVPSLCATEANAILDRLHATSFEDLVSANHPEAPSEGEDTISLNDIQETQYNNKDNVPMNNDKKSPLDSPANVAGLAFLDGVPLPKGTTYRNLVDYFTNKADEEERFVRINERIDAFVLEGAHAFQGALNEMFGSLISHGDAPVKPGQEDNPMALLAKLFGGDEEEPIDLITIPISLTQSEQVIWSKVRLPGLEGAHLTPGYTTDNGRLYFVIRGEVKKKDQARVMSLIELTKRHVRERSIYRGKALVLNMPAIDDRFDPLRHAPAFMEGLDAIDPEELVFSRNLEEALDVNLFTIIENTELVRELGLGLKRGNLLFGKPGVGKSFTAAVLATKAIANGWTFWYAKKAEQAVTMYKLAAQYPKSVLFIEDIDQVVQLADDDDDSEETRKFRELLNTLDGPDSKGDEVVVVFTTNKDPRTFNNAFTRPSGRLDFVIELTPPDAEAVGRLIRRHARGRLASDANLDTVATMLDGQSPATIGEVCKKALLAAAKRLGKGASAAQTTITAFDLEVAARAVLGQVALTSPAEGDDKPSSDRERAAVLIGKSLETGLEKIADTIATSVGQPATTEMKHMTNGHAAPRGNEQNASG